MIIGQTVWYRISEDDAVKTNKRRDDADSFMDYLLQLGSMTEPLESFLLNPGFVRHYGPDLEAGTLLPATVVKAYSVYEYDPEEEEDISWAKKTFSGVADIQVHLPGNDILWVEQALEDRTPTDFEQIYPGAPVTVLPAPGLFTCSSPADLLN